MLSELSYFILHITLALAVVDFHLDSYELTATSSFGHKMHLALESMGQVPLSLRLCAQLVFLLAGLCTSLLPVYWLTPGVNHSLIDKIRCTKTCLSG